MDIGGLRRHASSMLRRLAPTPVTKAFRFEITRTHGALRVTAHNPRGQRNSSPQPSSKPTVLAVHAVFSGNADGVWFRIEQRGTSRVFSQTQVVAHPALCAVLRLIADEVEAAQPCDEQLLSLLFQSLLVYVDRLSPASGQRGLRLVRNGKIERALELLNADLSKRWTVELLARAVGLSRPAFLDGQ